MTHTLTYNSIQNVQMRHHHVGRGISPYAPVPAHAQANATPPHARYCAAGSTSVIQKMTIPPRRSPFMDDLVKSNNLPLHQDWRNDLFNMCVQTGANCVIFTNLWMVVGQSGGVEYELKARGNQYWWMSQD
ncbi:hypothetical protein O181_036790 [Austropuccinia psidii MF-1]|uniref:Uncharacterized protein n=1 Tax=Austropuccinia psidii MF-1 TaxID=1389203 RepID=A0A9Q3D9L6_9BASI|nr:hypothetical protein [Austropuccinia psidii MF-1]